MQEHYKELLCSLHLESPKVVTLSLSLSFSLPLSLFFLPSSPLFSFSLSLCVHDYCPEPLKSKLQA